VGTLVNLLHLIWVYGHFGTISIYGKSWEIDIGSNQQNGEGRTNPQLIANARDIFHIASSNLPQKIRIDIIMVKSICP
jgi:hypothetical protein